MTRSAVSDPLPTPSGPAQPGSGPEERAPGEGTLPDWPVFARQHEWRRAQAAATLRQTDPALCAAITAVSTLQEDVRGKRYAAARRALDAYERHLSDIGPDAAGEAALLRSLAAPQTLRGALTALDQPTTYADVNAAQAALLPARAHALTGAEALNVQGVWHAWRQEAAEARAAFATAMQTDPGHYRARMNLGNLDLEAGDPATAEAHYREVLKLAPDYDGAHHNLSVALRRQGKYQASVGSMRRAQRLGQRQMQQENREEMREQLRANPRLRLIRTGAIVLVVALIVLAAWAQRGH